MAYFYTSCEVLLKNEGGLEENQWDRGGVTNFGISLKFYNSIHPDAIGDDIRRMTRDQAKKIYRENFWDNTRFADISSQPVANILLDFSVNAGIAESVKCVQRAINSMKGQHDHLVVDGVLGDATISILNKSMNAIIVPAIRSERAGFYRELVARRPSDIIFLNDWIRRAYAT